MARKPRVVAVGIPHHVTQRGNSYKDVFFRENDRDVYMDSFTKHAERQGLRVLGYCLMTNHVHFIVVPEELTSLARVFGGVHSDYARYANLVNSGCGHLWQARFYSCPLDKAHTWTALAYVERNPVRAGMVEDACAYKWSSAKTHCEELPSRIAIDETAWREIYDREQWREVLRSGVGEQAFRERLRQATTGGFPLGSDEFIEEVGSLVGRDLKSRPAGRPKKPQVSAA